MRTVSDATAGGVGLVALAFMRRGGTPIVASPCVGGGLVPCARRSEHAVTTMSASSVGIAARRAMGRSFGGAAVVGSFASRAEARSMVASPTPLSLTWSSRASGRCPLDPSLAVSPSF